MNSTKIPVVFSIDNEYVKQLAAVIKSILDNSDRDFEFNVLSRFISAENKEKLRSIALNFNFFDISAFIKNLPIEKYMYNKDWNYISIETYFRFFIPRIFDQYDKIIYLDADILVLDDLSMLYNENIDGCYAGAVQDLYIKPFWYTPINLTNPF